MSQADELLNSLLVDNGGEGHIVIGDDRYIIVPESLKRIGVQYDHNIETVTFDCPRYADGNDLVGMQVYVNYIRADGLRGSHLCTNAVVDPDAPTIMHFDWTISGHVTYVEGHISFMVCIKKVDAAGDEMVHWNSEINTDMYVTPGIKHCDVILAKYPDIIAQLLDRMNGVEEVNLDAKEAVDTIDAFMGEIEADVNVLEPGSEASVTKSDTEKSIKLTFNMPKGDTGERGAAFTYDNFTEEQLAALKGETGNGIVSISRTSGTGAPGTTDIYTILFTDGSTMTFNVYNGANGDGAGDMTGVMYDPQGKQQDIFKYVDDTVSNAIGDIGSILDSINGEVV